MTETDDERRLALIEDLLALPAETSWVEFKHNNTDPKMIGKYISALSNAARLSDKQSAYLVWGIGDEDRAVLGTDFIPSAKKHQNEPIEFWLSKRVKPDIIFSFHEIKHSDGRLVLLEISAAINAPIEFDRIAYIRIGSATPRLSDYPDRMRALLEKLRPYDWEFGVAKPFQTTEQVFDLLDYSAYFHLTHQTLLDKSASILERLSHEKLIIRDVGDYWNITNLGAILFAKNLNDFDMRLARKAIRLIVYDGSGRNSPVKKRQDDQLGYAIGFQNLMEYINVLLPENEHIDEALRIKVPLLPSVAIRELIANALIHQDMRMTGTGPLIEFFDDRLEITNPGTPLISPDRFIDHPPRSRNEALAALMRRMGMCEEAGSGIDKVVGAAEFYQLPPPDFREENNATKATLFAHRSFEHMTSEERIRACYQHAVLLHVSNKMMKNSTLRKRLGIEQQNSAQVSQVIRAALDEGKILRADPKRPRSGYIPFWADLPRI